MDLKSTFKDLDYFSTADAGAYAGLSKPIIVRQFDAGDIKGRRTPFGRQRMIHIKSFREWMVANDIPTTEFDKDYPELGG